MFFFFNDTATTEIYTLSLHDALPIYLIGIDVRPRENGDARVEPAEGLQGHRRYSRGSAIAPATAAVPPIDRKSTRLNSSHSQISYAVFCLKKKNKNNI